MEENYKYSGLHPRSFKLKLLTAIFELQLKDKFDIGVCLTDIVDYMDKRFVMDGDLEKQVIVSLKQVIKKRLVSSHNKRYKLNPPMCRYLDKHYHQNKSRNNVHRSNGRMTGKRYKNSANDESNTSIEDFSTRGSFRRSFTPELARSQSPSSMNSQVSIKSKAKVRKPSMRIQRPIIRKPPRKRRTKSQTKSPTPSRSRSIKSVSNFKPRKRKYTLSEIITTIKNCFRVKNRKRKQSPCKPRNNKCNKRAKFLKNRK